MSKTIIKAENIGKRYNIGHVEPYYSLRDQVANLFSFNKKNSQSEEFWALKNINFEIKQGESVGVIGRNGAGKSTLLKVLSQITPPTTGKITMYGRIASLLEVGTGFHPELTGRENIFLNGAILGMAQKEIKSKFDEIVSFSEIEKFLDTPVKRYSSGMYVRLAFAVAAHLEPEILIIDEVLAVGDVKFQKKCLGKMSEVAKNGRTVIFVSHNMSAIEQLCNSCMVLRQGQLVESGTDVRKIIGSYLSEGDEDGNLAEWTNKTKVYDNPWFKPTRFAIGNSKGVNSGPYFNDAEMTIFLEGEVVDLDPSLTFGYAIYTDDGLPVYISMPFDTAESNWPKIRPGKISLRTQIPKRFLNEGSYRIEFISCLHNKQWLCQPGKDNPQINLSISGGLSDSPYWTEKRLGVMAPIISWEVS